MTDKRWMTDEKIESIKNLPIWFTVSSNDSIVEPKNYVLPTYQALLQAGSKNSWLSVFETVKGTDSPGAEYMGHWSWVYLFNNQVKGVQDKEAIIASTDKEMFGTTPSNNNGGTLTSGEYANIFEWMNAQSK